jgi:DNA mismatch repair protein MLH1
VNWGDEQECFRTFLRELAYFYVPGPLAAGADAAPGDVADDDSEEARQECWQIEHVLFPAMRRYLVAPKTLLDRDVLQVASLPDLYRVFERC